MSPVVDDVTHITPRDVTFGTLDWSVAIGIAAMHVGLVLAPFYFTWTALAIVPFLYWFTGGVGITLGFHRLLTHGSFKTPRLIKYFLTTVGCTAWQGAPVQWVGVHRIHHQHSDEDLDPHTPRHGFSWSHVLWCMFRMSEGRVGADAAKDLLRDPGMRIINRLFWAPQLLLMVALFFMGEWVASKGISASGMSWVVWGVFVRTVLCYHSTWFVNSASHTWGYRNFKTTDNSRNLWWVALISFGEGWHNNHHAYQRSAAHGLRWFEFDLTYLTIRVLGKLGLAWDIVTPKESIDSPVPSNI